MAENQRVRLTKQMLKDSLLRLLEKNNIHELHVKEICQEAQINRSTFYKHYASQYDLFNEIETDTLTHVNNYFDPRSIEYEKQTLNACIFINDNAELLRILVRNSIDHEFPEKLIALQICRDIVAKRLDGKYGDRELAYIYTFIIYGGFSILRKWISRDERETPEEIAEMLNVTIMKAFV